MSWRKLLPLFLIVLMAGPALAINTIGKGGYVSVATDGYDDGYYLVVWSNSSGVFGRLYYVRTNTPAGDAIQIYNSSAFNTAVASSKVDNSQAGDNVYLVVWRGGDNYPYARLLGYDGSFITNVTQLNTQNKTDWVAAAYGNRYFVAVYEGGSTGIYQNLYYTVFDTAGNVKDSGLLYSFSGTIHYTSIAYDPVTGYFGVFLRNRRGTPYDASFLAFRLNGDGTLDRGSIRVGTVLSNQQIYGAAIASPGNGFVIGYETGYRWYTRKVTIDGSSGSISVSQNISLPIRQGYTAPGGGAMDFVNNGTEGYIVLAI